MIRSHSHLIHSHPHLIHSHPHLIHIHSHLIHRHLDHACSLILSGSDGCGKSSIVGNVVQSLGMHLLEFDCHNLNGDTAGATEAKIKDAFRRGEQPPQPLRFFSISDVRSLKIFHLGSTNHDQVPILVFMRYVIYIRLLLASRIHFGRKFHLIYCKIHEVLAGICFAKHFES